jgi:hypothetical protein
VPGAPQASAPANRNASSAGWFPGTGDKPPCYIGLAPLPSGGFSEGDSVSGCLSRTINFNIHLIARSLQHQVL